MTAREVVDGLIAFTERSFVRAGGPAGDLAEAWLAHVIQTARAALVLHDAGFGLEAAPLRRSVLEHAIWLQWVARHREEAWDVVRAKRRMTVKKNEAALRSWRPEETAALLQEPQRYVPTMKELLTNLPAGGDPSVWFGVYWSDSEHSHPSINTAAQTSGNADTDGPLAVGLLLALGAYSSMLPDNPWLDDLEAAGEALARVVGLTLRHGGEPGDCD